MSPPLIITLSEPTEADATLQNHHADMYGIFIAVSWHIVLWCDDLVGGGGGGGGDPLFILSGMEAFLF